jgi:hypothetical protein
VKQNIPEFLCVNIAHGIPIDTIATVPESESSGEKSRDFGDEELRNLS